MIKICEECKKEFEANTSNQKYCLKCGNARGWEKKKEKPRKKKKYKIAGVELKDSLFAAHICDRNYTLWSK